jgi:hypothetical protein
MAKNVKCEVEHYTVHKHFYGNGKAKFPQNARQKVKRSGFYTLVSLTVSTNANNEGYVLLNDVWDTHLGF